MIEDDSYSIGTIPLILMCIGIFVLGIFISLAFRGGNSVDISKIGQCSACPEIPGFNINLTCPQPEINYTALCKQPIVFVSVNGTNYTVDVQYANHSVHSYYVGVSEGINMAVNS